MVSGVRSFPILLLKKVNPTSMTRKETISAAIYSILPWPKGCSSSAGLSAIFTPTKLITEEAASERLLKASAVTEILFITIPITTLAANSSTLQQIPTRLESTP